MVLIDCKDSRIYEKNACVLAKAKYIGATSDAKRQFVG